MSLGGLIFSAGKGSRLGLGYNKGLIKYRDKPLIFYNIEILSQYCDSVSILVDFDKENLVTTVSKEYPHVNFIQQNKPGIANALEQAISKVTGESFLMCFGDELIVNHNIKQMIELFSAKNLFGVVGCCERTENTRYLIHKTFSIMLTDDKHIKKLEEKPRTLLKNNWQGTGYGIFSRKLLNYFSEHVVDYPSLIQSAIDDNNQIMMHVLTKNGFFNVNDINDLKELEKHA